MQNHPLFSIFLYLCACKSQLVHVEQTLNAYFCGMMGFIYMGKETWKEIKCTLCVASFFRG